MWTIVSCNEDRWGVTDYYSTACTHGDLSLLASCVYVFKQGLRNFRVTRHNPKTLLNVGLLLRNHSWHSKPKSLNLIFDRAPNFFQAHNKMQLHRESNMIWFWQEISKPVKNKLFWEFTVYCAKLPPVLTTAETNAESHAMSCGQIKVLFYPSWKHFKCFKNALKMFCAQRRTK